MGSQISLTFGINQWSPTFYSRHFGLSIGQIGLMLGVALGVGMTIGALVGGSVANRLMRHDLRWGAWMCMAAAALAVPITAVVFIAPTYKVALAATFLSAVLSGSTAGPITALVQSVASPRVRAAKSDIIKHKLFNEEVFKTAGVAMFYVSVKDEVKTLTMIDEAVAMGKRVCVPVILMEEKRLIAGEIKNRVRDLEWLIDKFWPVPTWGDDMQDAFDAWRAHYGY